MNSASKHAVIGLLVIFMAGCTPKNAQTTPPPQAQAPSIPAAGKAGAMYPPPLTESQTQSEPSTPAPAPEVAKVEPPPTPPPPPPATTKKTTHKPKPSATKPAGTDSGSTSTAGLETAAAAPVPASETTDIAAKTEPAAASPIGELAPADTPEQAQKGKDTNDLINKTEDGLTSIKRPLSTQEQETLGQIKAFLNKAKTALSNQDFDGAYILATKAKVLLDELNKT